MYARKHAQSILLNWLPLALWMSVIYWLSDQPSLPHPAREYGISDFLFDYTAHAMTFGFLMLLAWRAMSFRPTLLPERIVSLPLLSAGLLSALYAFSDEVHQSFVMGRSARFSDWLADVAGVLLAAIAISLAKRLHNWLRSLRRPSVEAMG